MVWVYLLLTARLPTLEERRRVGAVLMRIRVRVALSRLFALCGGALALLAASPGTTTDLVVETRLAV
jgi:hypothetical protein